MCPPESKLPNSPVLSVRQLTKSYGDYLAVDHISFEIQEGEILGLLGPNGAGKSTTMQMLLGLTEPDGGEIQYFGKDFQTHKEFCLSRINFASTYAELNMRLSVYQNLRVFAGLYNVPKPDERIAELLTILEIEETQSKLFWHLSAGQKTRVILAKALLNKPKMLLMDEPTASLDPDIVFKIIKLIKQLQEKEKIAILYTSHNMDEVTRLCDRVAFLSQGKIAIIGTPLELTKKMGDVRLNLAYEGKDNLVIDYLEKHQLPHELLRSQLIGIKVAEVDLPKVLFALQQKNISITSINIEKPSLEDVFLHISQHKTL